MYWSWPLSERNQSKFETWEHCGEMAFKENLVGFHPLVRNRRFPAPLLRICATLRPE
jgi:hypothetical protein